MHFLNNPASPEPSDDNEPISIAEGEAGRRPCQYPTCRNRIALTGMQYCETCRILALRNATVILLDPLSPITERADSIFYTAYHNMTTEEKINGLAKAEWIYLQYLKFTKLEAIQSKTGKRTFESLIDELEEERAKPGAPRTARKYKKERTFVNDAIEETKLTAKQKMQRKVLKITGNTAEAKKWFEDNVDF